MHPESDPPQLASGLLGGPFEHHVDAGRCRVCGAVGTLLDQWGCPARELPTSEGQRLVDARTFEAAAAEVWKARRDAG